MPFPDSPRVFYRQNPLKEVICQLRFPPILRISTGLPADFQDRVREDFPVYEHKLPVVNAEGIPAELVQAVQSAMGKEHGFQTEDGEWQLVLNAAFLALTTKAYRCWEDFLERLKRSVYALREVYRPAYFGRTGLRYRNRIVRSTLGLETATWAELLEPHVVGELAKPIEGTIQHARRELGILAAGEEKIVVRHGLVRQGGPGSEEECYELDADFFTEGRVEVDAAFSRLQDFHRDAGRFFRWCISDRLHRALEPADA